MEIINVGKRVAMLRKEKGWSQLELAEKLNVSDKTVSKWENGGMPGIDLFPKMAKLFGVSIDFLMMGNTDSNFEEDRFIENDSIDTENVDLSATEDTDNTPVISENEEHNTIEAKTLPDNYECPKCKRINRKPGANCQYCFHSFIDDIDDDVWEEVSMIICSKCGKTNPPSSSRCHTCYHEFTEEEKITKKLTNKADNTVNRNAHKRRIVCPNCGEVNLNASSGDNCSFCGWKLEIPNTEHKVSRDRVQHAVANGTQSSSGCLIFFIAFFIPLFGLIFGAVKRDKSLIIFSIVMMIIDFIVFLLHMIVNLIGVMLIPEPAGYIFVR